MGRLNARVTSYAFFWPKGHQQLVSLSLLCYNLQHYLRVDGFMEVATIEIDETSTTNEEWKRIVFAKLKNAAHFEIHCWNEEQEKIQMALKFGRLKENAWSYGKVVTGSITKKFVAFLLSCPKPTDTEIYNKMTPFFSIFFDNGFSSEHYGTQLNQQIETLC